MKIGDYVRINKLAINYGGCIGIVEVIDMPSATAYVKFISRNVGHLWYEFYKLDVLSTEELFLLKMES